MRRKHNIHIHQNNQISKIECSEQETILEAMVRQGISYRSDCGGRGSCGKCKLQVLSGTLKVTAWDKVLFTEQELDAGVRLACKAIAEEDLTILLGNSSDQGLKGITQSIHSSSNIDAALEKAEADADSAGCILGIDLGSTTLAFQLLDRRQGKPLASYSMVNPQRAYGADVVSRIKASNDGKADQLMRLIRTALEEGIKAVFQAAQLSIEMLRHISIAGNTTMIHLLMGYSCQGLGVYPFTPVTLDTITTHSNEIFPGLQVSDIPVTILPAISAFAGGDIVAGLAVCGYPNTEEISLLIDFGTNGEIALGNKNKLLVTSTAAGPAFEGGNLSCGTGSIPGAINHVKISDGKISYDTIEQQPATGICGTGAIELVSELYRNGIIDDTGLLQEEYFASGYPLLDTLVLTQKDIREMQMAKAAVRAGIEILLKRYGIGYSQVHKVYLAGGFGFYLDIQKAIRIGLLPEAFQDKILTVGNSSLAGAVMTGRDQALIRQMKNVIANSQELHLSNDEDFQELYLKYMYFASPDTD